MTLDEQQLRLIIVGRRLLMQEALATFLNSTRAAEVVGEAADIDEAIHLVIEHHPHIILTGMSTPDIDPVALVSRLKHEAYPDIPVVVLSLHHDVSSLEAVMGESVAGVLDGDITCEALIDALRAVRHGFTVLNPPMRQAIAQRLNHCQPESALGTDSHQTLTPRQEVVLNLLAEGLSNKEIASKLDVGVRTVEMHVNSILTRLGVQSRTAAVVTALRLGQRSANN